MENENTNNREKSLSTKQLIALVFIIGLGLNMLNLPTLAVMEGGRDGWLVMLFITVLDCLSLFSTLLIMEKLEKLKAGKAIKRTLEIVFGIVGGIWALAKLLLLMGEARLFYGGTVFENLDWLVFLIILGVLTAIMGAGGSRALGRLGELALPIAVITVAVLVFTTYIGNVDLTDVFPTLYNNPGALRSPIKLAMWMGNYPVLLSFFGKVKLKKSTKYFGLGAGFLTGITSAVMTLPLSATYGSITHLIAYGNNTSDMNQFVGSYNFGRIDLIVFTVWSVVLLIEMGIFQYAFVRATSAVAGKYKPWIYSLSASLIVYILLNTALSCKFKLFTFASSIAGIPALVIGIGLPALAAVATAIAVYVKKKRGEKDYEQE